MELIDGDDLRHRLLDWYYGSLPEIPFPEPDPVGEAVSETIRECIAMVEDMPVVQRNPEPYECMIGIARPDGGEM